MNMEQFKPMDLTLPKHLGFRLRLLILWSDLIDDIAMWKCERKLRRLKVTLSKQRK